MLDLNIGKSQLYSYMEGDVILPATDRELNRVHKKIWKECVGEAVPAEMVYDLKL